MSKTNRSSQREPHDNNNDAESYRRFEQIWNSFKAPEKYLMTAQIVYDVDLISAGQKKEQLHQGLLPIIKNDARYNTLYNELRAAKKNNIPLSTYIKPLAASNN